MTTESPPIILLTVDAVRRDSVGCYRGEGMTQELTPHLSNFAESAAVAESYISTGNGTPNAMTGLFTSCYRTETGRRNQRAPGWLTTELHDSGYTTAGFHSNPRLRPANGYHNGFDCYPGRDESEEDVSRTKTTNISQDVKKILRQISHKRPSFYRLLKTWQLNRNLPYERGDVITDRVLRWLDEHSEGPRFVFAHYMDAHDPYLPLDSPIDGQLSRWKMAYHNTYLNLLTGDDFRHNSPYTGVIEILHSLYKTEMRFLDAQLGRLFEGLRARGLFEDALIIVLSDHGEEFLDHGWVRHGKHFYDEMIRVPLLIKPPTDNPREDRIKGLISTLDISPTILDYADVPSPSYMSGRSLRNSVKNGISSRESAVSIAIPTRGTNPYRWACIRTSSMKYMYYEGMRDSRHYAGSHSAELYNLSEDPDERTNIVSDKSNKAERLHEKMTKELTWESWDQQQWHGINTPTENVTDRLENLGYF